ncbi:hypothetical protein NLX86_12170 [Streptomyces sp. A3M-1-3]|uniref:hypothetical protein n=1 Tax=Streptomyces sp. A3M-1-3 TaxID=2962044 RepID=UPI0020B84F3E|nr:hypothetical protein [Streptomyces sp. A3M-1-3]MCP3818837.1 hypothetical protein [Streptomyces sp. A3M-1-3]
MPTPVPPRRRDGPDRPGAGFGLVAVLMAVCCAAPVLILSGALAGAGAWLGNPVVIAVAVVLAVGVVAAVFARRAHRPPASSASDFDDRDRPSRPASQEGPDDR